MSEHKLVFWDPLIIFYLSSYICKCIIVIYTELFFELVISGVACFYVAQRKSERELLNFMFLGFRLILRQVRFHYSTLCKLVCYYVAVFSKLINDLNDDLEIYT